MAKSPVPLMLLSDGPTCGSGLGRICCDLATRVATHLPDLYRVCTLGYGGPYSANLPFQQFDLGHMEEWVLRDLPEKWHGWAGNEKGVLMVIWDASRLGWLAQPNGVGREQLLKEPLLYRWLQQRKNMFELWTYSPIDASGPNDRLTFPLMQTFLGFDRILAYGEFGEGVIRRTIGDEESDKRHLTHLPHGIDYDKFFELPRKVCRQLFFKRTGAVPVISELGPDGKLVKPKPIEDDEVLIGIVATNQRRKHWQLALETCALLSRKMKVRVWIHTNKLEAEWSIPALLIDYGLVYNAILTTNTLPDTIMAECYSACDITIAPGRGEGFCYPAMESLFCGTPCVHANYAGAPQWMAHPDLLVEPVAFDYEGEYCCKRPVCRAEDFVEKIIPLIGKRVTPPSELDWQNLWTRWSKWFTEGAK